MSAGPYPPHQLQQWHHPKNPSWALTRRSISHQLGISVISFTQQARADSCIQWMWLGPTCNSPSMDPGDWPLVCFCFQGAYYTDISLPFGFCWAAAHCQDITSLITRALNRKGASVLSYIDDFGDIAMDQAAAGTHFNNHRALLARLGLHRAAHKASFPSQVMVWLDLQFDNVAMTVSLTLDTLSEIQLSVHM